jgi:hypothetical protein
LRVLFLRFQKMGQTKESQPFHRATDVIMLLARHLWPEAVALSVVVVIVVAVEEEEVMVVPVPVPVPVEIAVQGLRLESRDLAKGRFALAKSRIKGSRHAEGQIKTDPRIERLRRTKGRIEAKGRIEGLCLAKGRIPGTSEAMHAAICPRQWPNLHPGRCLAPPPRP